MQQIKVVTYSKKKENDHYDSGSFTFTRKATFTAVTTVNGKRKQLTLTKKNKKYFSRFGKEALRDRTIKALIYKCYKLEVKSIETEVKKFKHYMNNKNWSVKFHTVTLN